MKPLGLHHGMMRRKALRRHYQVDAGEAACAKPHREEPSPAEWDGAWPEDIARSLSVAGEDPNCPCEECRAGTRRRPSARCDACGCTIVGDVQGHLRVCGAPKLAEVLR